jgi:hypothetical protein
MIDYLVGLDLGQAADYSALGVLERTQETVDVREEGKLPRKEQVRAYGCRRLKRWPIGTPYTTIVRDVGNLLRRAPLANATLVIDATGVGRPVVDMFRALRLPNRLVAVTITAGQAETFHDGFHRVSKIIVIHTLQVLLQQRRLRFAQTMAEVPLLIRELQNYRMTITPALNETFNAREGEHDDLILALAIAAWEGERNVGPPIGSCPVIAIGEGTRTSSTWYSADNPHRKNRYTDPRRRWPHCLVRGDG